MREKASDLKSMIEHEKICFANPKNKACLICKHLIVNPECLICKKVGMYKNNDSKDVYDLKTNKLIFDFELENTPLISRPILPFPTKNCIHFQQGKRNF